MDPLSYINRPFVFANEDVAQHVKYRPLMFCSSFLSFPFNDKTITLNYDDIGLTYQLSLDQSPSDCFTRFLTTVVKVALWATLIFPLLAAIGAFIFIKSNSIVLGNEDGTRVTSAPPPPPTNRDSLAGDPPQEVEQKRIFDRAGGSGTSPNFQVTHAFAANRLTIPPGNAPVVQGDPKKSSEVAPANVEEERKVAVDTLSTLIESYLQAHPNQKLTTGKINEFCTQGGNIYRAVRAGKSLTYTDESSKREAVVSFVWFLMGMAIERREEFGQGAFTIPDSEGHFFKFFKNLGVGSSRISSHIKAHTSPGGVFGINIDSAELPGEMKHVLFQSVEVGGVRRLFIKPEDHGLPEGQNYVTDAFHLIGHAGGFALSLMRKVPAFQGIVGSDEGPGDRKERIPEFIASIVKALNIPTGHKEALLERIGKGGTGVGVQAIHHYLKELIAKEEREGSGTDRTVRQVLEGVKKELEDKLGSIEFRFGKEVVFVETDFDVSPAARPLAPPLNWDGEEVVLVSSEPPPQPSRVEKGNLGSFELVDNEESAG